MIFEILKRSTETSLIRLISGVVQTSGEPAPAPANRAGGNVAGPVSLLSNYEFWLTVCVLGFGIFAIVLSCRYISASRNHQPEHIIRAIAVNLIVIGTLVTITGGLSDKQIAPAFGLFGTIAGYLLGRSERKDTTDPVPAQFKADAHE